MKKGISTTNAIITRTKTTNTTFEILNTTSKNTAQQMNNNKTKMQHNTTTKIKYTIYNTK